MKSLKYILLILFVMAYTFGISQKDSSSVGKQSYPVRKLTTEPGLGFHTNFGTDLLISNLMQWTPSRRLTFASHTSWNLNNLFQRNFNTIQTDYNYSINQKFGIGTTFYTRRSANTFLLMIGAKYTSFKETLNNPQFDKFSSTINTVSPDYGFMYSFKKGVKKYFFSFRMYLPFYPWPIKNSNILTVDGNLNNISLECGLGIKIK